VSDPLIIEQMNYCPHMRAGGRTTGRSLIQGWHMHLCSKQDTTDHQGCRTEPLDFAPPLHTPHTHIPAIDRSPHHHKNHVVCFVCQWGPCGVLPNFLVRRSRCSFRRRGAVFRAGSFQVGRGGGTERAERRLCWAVEGGVHGTHTRLCGRPVAPLIRCRCRCISEPAPYLYFVACGAGCVICVVPCCTWSAY
jgi:hypothetical protein